MSGGDHENMDNIGIVIAGLFYMAALVCVLVGLYLLYINIDTLLNRLGFLLCCSLSCWCVGAARSLIALDIADSLVWRRFAAIGVGTFFCFFLHYIIVLTDRENFLKNGWTTFAIYIPSIIVVYFFALYKKTTTQIYHLEKTPIGWISTSGFDWWMIFFYTYIISFMGVGLYMIYKWKTDRTKTDTKKQATLILASSVIFFTVGIIAEVLNYLNLNSYLNEV